jgi:peptidoglycan/xylan/chitin deacetylase (PgdA/CDA1 family)
MEVDSRSSWAGRPRLASHGASCAEEMRMRTTLPATGWSSGGAASGWMAAVVVALAVAAAALWPAAAGADDGEAAGEAAAATSPVGPLVALTFDAGADRGNAGAILDLLAAEQVPASFGVTGAWARANPALVVRMGAEGHLVVNHTLSHRSFTGRSDRLGGSTPAGRRAELEAADAILAPLLGYSTRP